MLSSPESSSWRDDLRREFRCAMAGVCTPVSVVTTIVDGNPHGTTVSAFASLSVEPPMVLVSLDRASVLLSLIRQSGVFGLNVLSVGQQDLAMRFAAKGSEKFAGLAWRIDNGVPRLPETAVWIACRVGEFTAGGDHFVVTGEVVGVDWAQVEPLTYHARVFGTHAPRSIAS